MREIVEGQGCELLYLPPYSSPDLLDPIEQAFSKLEASLRRAGARTFEGLIEAMGGGRWTRSPTGTPWASSGSVATVWLPRLGKTDMTDPLNALGVRPLKWPRSARGYGA